MPTFPTAADMRRPVPRPSEGVASYRTGKAAEYGTEAAQTLFESGRQMQEDARTIDALGAQLDQVAAQDALNKLRTIRQESTYDPEKGFRRYKGGDVLQKGPDGRPLMQGLSDQLKAQSDEISGKLLSPRAKALFSAAAANEQRLYKHDMAVYFGQQTEVYEAAVYKDTQTSALGEVAQVFMDPAKVEAVATRAERAALTRAQQLGIPGEALAMGARSNVYRVAVESLLASGNARGALTYYDNVKGKLDGADAVALQARLKSTATEVEADTVIQGYKGMAIPETVRRYDPLIQQAAAKHGVDPALVTAVMSQESKGNPRAVSSAGAGGLMQLMPGTAKDLGVANVFDEGQNVDGGVNYLKQMLARHNGNERLALMSYNWGPGNVDKWLKTGADPEMVPQETRDYVNKVAGYKASIGTKSDVKTAQMDILNRSDIPKAVKAAAYTQIEKESAAFEAYKAAEFKTLEDNARVVLTTAMIDPSNYKDGTLLNYAHKFAALGKGEEAARFMVLASMEGTLKNFTTSATDAQRSTISELLKGLPKEIADGILKGDNKGRAEAKVRGTEAFGVLKESFKGGVGIEGLKKQAAETIEHFSQAGDVESARKVAEFFETAVKGTAIAQQTPEQANQTIAEMKALADAGRARQQDLQMLDLAGEVVRRQETAFAKDAYEAGTKLYPQVGAPIPVNWNDKPENIAATLQMKSMQATQISRLRGGLEVLPFSQEEIASYRFQLDNAPPDQQAKLLSTLASLPADQLPRVAAALAGKKDAGDPLSRSYAAAMSFFAERDPAQAAVANQILRGAQIIKAGGDAGRKPATTGDAWQTVLQDRFGTIFQDMGVKVPAVISDAVASHYVYQMHRAGRQGEKPDPDMLDKSITAVMGQSIVRNGQAILPPVRGMTRYEFDNVLGRLTNGDTDGLRTGEGDPVTADVIRRRGVLSNVGDGLYKVRIPDPRRNGDLAEIINPETGSAWLLDAKSLMQRSPILSTFTPGTPMTPPLGAR